MSGLPQLRSGSVRFTDEQLELLSKDPAKVSAILETAIQNKMPMASPSVPPLQPSMTGTTVNTGSSTHQYPQTSTLPTPSQLPVYSPQTPRNPPGMPFQPANDQPRYIKRDSAPPGHKSPPHGHGGHRHRRSTSLGAPAHQPPRGSRGANRLQLFLPHLQRTAAPSKPQGNPRGREDGEAVERLPQVVKSGLPPINPSLSTSIGTTSSSPPHTPSRKLTQISKSLDQQQTQTAASTTKPLAIKKLQTTVAKYMAIRSLLNRDPKHGGNGSDPQHDDGGGDGDSSSSDDEHQFDDAAEALEPQLDHSTAPLDGSRHDVLPGEDHPTMVTLTNHHVTTEQQPSAMAAQSTQSPTVRLSEHTGAAPFASPDMSDWVKLTNEGLDSPLLTVDQLDKISGYKTLKPHNDSYSVTSSFNQPQPPPSVGHGQQQQQQQRSTPLLGPVRNRNGSVYSVATFHSQTPQQQPIRLPTPVLGARPPSERSLPPPDAGSNMSNAHATTRLGRNMSSIADNRISPGDSDQEGSVASEKLEIAQFLASPESIVNSLESDHDESVVDEQSSPSSAIHDMDSFSAVHEPAYVAPGTTHNPAQSGVAGVAPSSSAWLPVIPSFPQQYLSAHQQQQNQTSTMPNRLFDYVISCGVPASTVSDTFTASACDPNQSYYPEPLEQQGRPPSHSKPRVLSPIPQLLSVIPESYPDSKPADSWAHLAFPEGLSISPTQRPPHVHYNTITTGSASKIYVTFMTLDLRHIWRLRSVNPYRILISLREHVLECFTQGRCLFTADEEHEVEVFPAPTRSPSPYLTSMTAPGLDITPLTLEGVPTRLLASQPTGPRRAGPSKHSSSSSTSFRGPSTSSDIMSQIKQINNGEFFFHYPPRNAYDLGSVFRSSEMFDTKTLQYCYDICDYRYYINNHVNYVALLEPFYSSILCSDYNRYMDELHDLQQQQYYGNGLDDDGEYSGLADHQIHIPTGPHHQHQPLRSTDIAMVNHGDTTTPSFSPAHATSSLPMISTPSRTHSVSRQSMVQSQAGGNGSAALLNHTLLFSRCKHNILQARGADSGPNYQRSIFTVPTAKQLHKYPPALRCSIEVIAASTEVIKRQQHYLEYLSQFDDFHGDAHDDDDDDSHHDDPYDSQSKMSLTEILRFPLDHTTADTDAGFYAAGAPSIDNSHNSARLFPSLASSSGGTTSSDGDVDNDVVPAFDDFFAYGWESLRAFVLGPLYDQVVAKMAEDSVKAAAASGEACGITPSSSSPDESESTSLSQELQSLSEKSSESKPMTTATTPPRDTAEIVSKLFLPSMRDVDILLYKYLAHFHVLPSLSAPHDPCPSYADAYDTVHRFYQELIVNEDVLVKEYEKKLHDYKRQQQDQLSKQQTGMQGVVLEEPVPPKLRVNSVCASRDPQVIASTLFRSLKYPLPLLLNSDDCIIYVPRSTGLLSHYPMYEEMEVLLHNITNLTQIEYAEAIDYWATRDYNEYNALFDKHLEAESDDTASGRLSLHRGATTPVFPSIDALFNTIVDDAQYHSHQGLPVTKASPPQVLAPAGSPYDSSTINNVLRKQPELYSLERIMTSLTKKQYLSLEQYLQLLLYRAPVPIPGKVAVHLDPLNPYCRLGAHAALTRLRSDLISRAQSPLQHHQISQFIHLLSHQLEFLPVPTRGLFLSSKLSPAPAPAPSPSGPATGSSLHRHRPQLQYGGRHMSGGGYQPERQSQFNFPSQTATILDTILPVTITLPSTRNPLVSSFGLYTIFSTLSVDTILLVLTALIIERQVIVYSSNTRLIPVIMYSFLQLLQPLEYDYLFVPVLPISMISMLNVLGSLHACFVGIPQDHLDYVEPTALQDMVVLDVDAGTISAKSLPALPSPYVDILVDSLCNTIAEMKRAMACHSSSSLSASFSQSTLLSGLGESSSVEAASSSLSSLARGVSALNKTKHITPMAPIVSSSSLAHHSTVTNSDNYVTGTRTSTITTTVTSQITTISDLSTDDGTPGHHLSHLHLQFDTQIYAAFWQFYAFIFKNIREFVIYKNGEPYLNKVNWVEYCHLTLYHFQRQYHLEKAILAFNTKTSLNYAHFATLDDLKRYLVELSQPSTSPGSYEQYHLSLSHNHMHGVGADINSTVYRRAQRTTSHRRPSVSLTKLFQRDETPMTGSASPRDSNATNPHYELDIVNENDTDDSSAMTTTTSDVAVAPLVVHTNHGVGALGGHSPTGSFRDDASYSKISRTNRSDSDKIESEYYQPTHEDLSTPRNQGQRDGNRPGSVAPLKTPGTTPTAVEGRGGQQTPSRNGEHSDGRLRVPPKRNNIRNFWGFFHSSSSSSLSSDDSSDDDDEDFKEFSAPNAPPRRGDGATSPRPQAAPRSSIDDLNSPPPPAETIGLSYGPDGSIVTTGTQPSRMVQEPTHPPRSAGSPSYPSLSSHAPSSLQLDDPAFDMQRQASISCVKMEDFLNSPRNETKSLSSQGDSSVQTNALDVEDELKDPPSIVNDSSTATSPSSSQTEPVISQDKQLAPEPSPPTQSSGQSPAVPSTPHPQLYVDVTNGQRSPTPTPTPTTTTKTTTTATTAATITTPISRHPMQPESATLPISDLKAIPSTASNKPRPTPTSKPATLPTPLNHSRQQSGLRPSATPRTMNPSATSTPGGNISASTTNLYATTSNLHQRNFPQSTSFSRLTSPVFDHSRSGHHGPHFSTTSGIPGNIQESAPGSIDTSEAVRLYNEIVVARSSKPAATPPPLPFFSIISQTHAVHLFCGMAQSSSILTDYLCLGRHELLQAAMDFEMRLYRHTVDYSLVYDCQQQQFVSGTHFREQTQDVEHPTGRSGAMSGYLPHAKGPKAFDILDVCGEAIISVAPPPPPMDLRFMAFESQPDSSGAAVTADSYLGDGSDLGPSDDRANLVSVFATTGGGAGHAEHNAKQMTPSSFSRPSSATVVMSTHNQARAAQHNVPSSRRDSMITAAYTRSHKGVDAKTTTDDSMGFHVTPSSPGNAVHIVLPVLYPRDVPSILAASYFSAPTSILSSAAQEHDFSYIYSLLKSNIPILNRTRIFTFDQLNVSQQLLESTSHLQYTLPLSLIKQQAQRYADASSHGIGHGQHQHNQMGNPPRRNTITTCVTTTPDVSRTAAIPPPQPTRASPDPSTGAHTMPAAQANAISPRASSRSTHGSSRGQSARWETSITHKDLSNWALLSKPTRLQIDSSLYFARIHNAITSLCTESHPTAEQHPSVSGQTSTSFSHVPGSQSSAPMPGHAGNGNMSSTATISSHASSSTSSSSSTMDSSVFKVFSHTVTPYMYYEPVYSVGSPYGYTVSTNPIHHPQRSSSYDANLEGHVHPSSLVVNPLIHPYTSNITHLTTPLAHAAPPYPDTGYQKPQAYTASPQQYLPLIFPFLKKAVHLPLIGTTLHDHGRLAYLSSWDDFQRSNSGPLCVSSLNISQFQVARGASTQSLPRRYNLRRQQHILRYDRYQEYNHILSHYLLGLAASHMKYLQMATMTSAPIPLYKQPSDPYSSTGAVAGGLYPGSRTRSHTFHFRRSSSSIPHLPLLYHQQQQQQQHHHHASHIAGVEPHHQSLLPSFYPQYPVDGADEDYCDANDDDNYSAILRSSRLDGCGISGASVAYSSHPKDPLADATTLNLRKALKQDTATPRASTRFKYEYFSTVTSVKETSAAAGSQHATGSHHANEVDSMAKQVQAYQKDKISENIDYILTNVLLGRELSPENRLFLRVVTRNKRYQSKSPYYFLYDSYTNQYHLRVVGSDFEISRHPVTNKENVYVLNINNVCDCLLYKNTNTGDVCHQCHGIMLDQLICNFSMSAAGHVRSMPHSTIPASATGSSQQQNDGNRSNPNTPQSATRTLTATPIVPPRSSKPSTSLSLSLSKIANNQEDASDTTRPAGHSPRSIPPRPGTPSNNQPSLATTPSLSNAPSGASSSHSRRPSVVPPPIPPRKYFPDNTPHHLFKPVSATAFPGFVLIGMSNYPYYRYLQKFNLLPPHHMQVKYPDALTALSALPDGDHFRQSIIELLSQIGVTQSQRADEYYTLRDYNRTLVMSTSHDGVLHETKPKHLTYREKLVLQKDITTLTYTHRLPIPLAPMTLHTSNGSSDATQVHSLVEVTADSSDVRTPDSHKTTGSDEDQLAEQQLQPSSDLYICEHYTVRLPRTGSSSLFQATTSNRYQLSPNSFYALLDIMIILLDSCVECGDWSSALFLRCLANEYSVYKHQITHQLRPVQSPIPPVPLSLVNAMTIYKFSTDVYQRGVSTLTKTSSFSTPKQASRSKRASILSKFTSNNNQPGGIAGKDAAISLGSVANLQILAPYIGNSSIAEHLIQHGNLDQLRVPSYTHVTFYDPWVPPSAHFGFTFNTTSNSSGSERTVPPPTPLLSPSKYNVPLTSSNAEPATETLAQQRVFSQHPMWSRPEFWLLALVDQANFWKRLNPHGFHVIQTAINKQQCLDVRQQYLDALGDMRQEFYRTHPPACTISAKSLDPSISAVYNRRSITFSSPSKFYPDDSSWGGHSAGGLGSGPHVEIFRPDHARLLAIVQPLLPKQPLQFNPTMRNNYQGFEAIDAENSINNEGSVLTLEERYYCFHYARFLMVLIIESIISMNDSGVTPPIIIETVGILLNNPLLSVPIWERHEVELHVYKTIAALDQINH